jgi:hypothetical protein
MKEQQGIHEHMLVGGSHSKFQDAGNPQGMRTTLDQHWNAHNTTRAMGDAQKAVGYS